MLEKEIQNQILRQFATRDDFRLWRASTGFAVPMQEIKAVLAKHAPAQAAAVLSRLHPIHFGVTGQADLSGIIPGGTRIEIEVKQKDGRTSKEQQAWGAMIQRFGGVYVVARSVDDVAVALEPFMGGAKA